MFCRNCGAELQNGVCPACGCREPSAPAEPAAPQGAEPNPAGQPAPGYVPPAAQPYAYAQGAVPPAEDKKSAGLNVLSFFFPLVGLILYLTTKSEKPVRAKSMGKSALAGFLVGLVVTIASYALLFWIGYRAYQDGALDDLTIDGEQVIVDGEPVSGGLFDDAQTSANDGAAGGGAANDTAFSWSGVTLLVDGTELSLPCSYAEFTQRTGYAVEPDEASALEELLGENSTTTPIDAQDARGREIEIKLFNPDAGSKLAKDCLVVGIVTDRSFDDPYADIVFPGGVCVGGAYDLEALRAVYGQEESSFASDSGAYTSALWRDAANPYNVFRVYSADAATIYEIELCLYPAA